MAAAETKQGVFWGHAETKRPPRGQLNPDESLSVVLGFHARAFPGLVFSRYGCLHTYHQREIRYVVPALKW